MSLQELINSVKSFQSDVRKFSEHLNTVVNSILDLHRRLERVENDIIVIQREINYLKASQDLEEKRKWWREP